MLLGSSSWEPLNDKCIQHLNENQGKVGGRAKKKKVGFFRNKLLIQFWVLMLDFGLSTHPTMFLSLVFPPVALLHSFLSFLLCVNSSSIAAEFTGLPVK